MTRSQAENFQLRLKLSRARYKSGREFAEAFEALAV